LSLSPCTSTSPYHHYVFTSLNEIQWWTCEWIFCYTNSSAMTMVGTCIKNSSLVIMVGIMIIVAKNTTNSTNLYFSFKDTLLNPNHSPLLTPYQNHFWCHEIPWWCHLVAPNLMPLNPLRQFQGIFFHSKFFR
jgi:hypothetical protein